MKQNPSFDIGTTSISNAQEFLEDAKTAYKKLEKTVDDAIKKTLSTNFEEKIPGEIAEFVYGTLPIRLVTSTGALRHAVHHLKESSAPRLTKLFSRRQFFPLFDFPTDLRRRIFPTCHPLISDPIPDLETSKAGQTVRIFLTTKKGGCRPTHIFCSPRQGNLIPSLPSRLLVLFFSGPGLPCSQSLPAV